MSEQQKGRAFVALAAVVWSTAGLFQRELAVDTATQIAGRAAFAALGLLVYVVATERRETLRAFRALGLSGLAVAALIAVSSASFIAALNHASVANVLFMMALAPILAAALGTLVGDPVDLGRRYRSLRRRFGHFCVLGGCCGTDHRHVEQISRACMAVAV